jgi:hypothetical protein
MHERKEDATYFVTLECFRRQPLLARQQLNLKTAVTRS